MNRPKRYQLPWIDAESVQEYEKKNGCVPLIIGREYEYMGNPVTIRDIPVRCEPLSHSDVTVEARFGDLATITVSELGWRA